MIINARILHLDGFDTKAAMQAARWARGSSMPITIDLDTIYPGIDELLPLVDCLITSQALAHDLTGTMDEREALSRLHERYGCYLVAMTQGSRGALAYVDHEYIASSAFRPPVIRDTTGAGDAFRAGFIYGLCRGLEIEETMRVANAVAALQCREMGARDGLPTEAELTAFLAGGG
jgi:sugar/nucleoside kinase (ribokinase family)